MLPLVRKIFTLKIQVTAQQLSAESDSGTFDCPT